MLQIDGVSKTYGERAAVSDVSFAVGDGRITGFVGGNGAGKTTTMRIILGVLDADSGQVTLGGEKLTASDRRIFGYMPEERGLYPKMRVSEQIVYLGRLHGMSQRDAQASTTRLLDRLELAARANDPVESLSLGNQQRAQIAAALVHEPEVLILDEPFSGLDPMGVETVLGVLRDAAAGGAPVLFSSHQLDLVERLCDDLVIISEGTIRASASRDELRAQHGHARWELVVDGDVGWIRDVPGVTVIEFDGGHALFEATDPSIAQGVLRRAMDSGGVTQFAPQHPSLAQIFTEVIE
ncbi:ATP-binding cassette domain-containing protein [Glaciihabitans sp. UYNi722]|uniref:ABC transporter ATP-binding protein n=1 Tax=Glaciihabitans sp. UYNi722 TaxID=3156344 RepID=UPI0033910CC5